GFPGATALIALQRSLGNRAVVELLQRTPQPRGQSDAVPDVAAETGPGPSSEEPSGKALETLEEMLDEFTDEELARAAVEEFGEAADLVGEEASGPAPDATTDVQRR